MCDYCDCRRMEPIAELSEEHERLLALSARIRADLRRGDEAAAEARLATLMAVLRPHAEREERGLFRALAADEDLAGAVPGLLADHARLDDPGPFSAAAATAFLDDLAAHILLEEHDVFPAATQLLPAEAWEALAAAPSPAAP